jgi:hypothetical protein
MKHYRDVLSNFVATDFGDAIPTKAVGSDEALREDLRAVMKSDAKYFNLCVGLILLLFLGAVILVLTNLNSPERITVVFGVTGISFAALLKQMTGLWREKAHSEIAYTLASKLPPEDLKAVIILLLQGT